ncbi:MAG: hypothetical protein RR206_00770 [Bacteroidaceae bacterium]
MSDGNFNKALLPHTNYQSGIRAGKAMMRKLAIESFEKVLADYALTTTEEDYKELFLSFKKRLDK